MHLSSQSRNPGDNKGQMACIYMHPSRYQTDNCSGFPLPVWGGDALCWVFCPRVQRQGWVVRPHLRVSQPPLRLHGKVRDPCPQVQEFGEETRGLIVAVLAHLNGQILHILVTPHIWDDMRKKDADCWAWNVWSLKLFWSLIMWKDMADQLNQHHVERYSCWTKAGRDKETTVESSESSCAFFPSQCRCIWRLSFLAGSKSSSKLYHSIGVEWHYNLF